MKITKVEAASKFEKLRVAAYCRVSTNQAEQEESLETQQRTYTTHIRSNPAWQFVGIYSDTRSGLSAEKRPGFLHLIEDCMAGKIDLILCKSISRFSRNIVECQRYTEKLRSKNITVIFEKEKLRTDAPTSSLIFSLMSVIAQDESRSISENIQTSNRHRVEAGIYTPRRNQMLGYNVKDGKLSPDQDAWIIRHIFTRYAAGATIAAICRELQALGAHRKRVPSMFTVSVIQRILRNESYVGDKQLQKQPPWNYLTKRPDPSHPYSTTYLTNDHEPIISRATWLAVQQRIQHEAHTRKGKVPNADLLHTQQATS